jgi:drug/metabolite transporter (DMT)-like permease
MRIEKMAPLLVVAAATFWGIDSIVLRPALYTLPVTLVVFIESLFVTVLLSFFFFRRIKEIADFSKKEWLAFWGVAITGGAIGTMAITKALFYVDFVNLSIVVLIQKMQPVFTLAGAAILLKERQPKIFFLWAVLAMIGAYVMTFGLESPKIYTGNHTVMAAGLALIAAISFSLSTIFSKRALRRIDYGLGTYVRFLVFTAVMLIIVVPSGKLGEVSSVSNDQWIIFIIIALTTGGLATYLFYSGLKYISASLSSICELAFPLTAILLEFLLRDHLLNYIQWTGVAILFFSIYRVSRLKVRENVKEEAS